MNLSQTLVMVWCLLPFPFPSFSLFVSVFLSKHQPKRRNPALYPPSDQTMLFYHPRPSRKQFRYLLGPVHNHPQFVLHSNQWSCTVPVSFPKYQW